MRRMMWVLTLLALLAPASVFAGGDVMFAYKFEAGASQRYRVHMNVETDFGGALMSQLADLEVTLKCATVAETGNAMEMVFDKAEMSRAMFGNVQADPSAAALVGKSVTFTVDGVGKVSDIKPAGYFEEWNTLKAIVSPIIENWFAYLPGKAVAPGGEWKKDNEKNTEGGMEITSNSAFKFKEMKKDKGRECAIIECSTETVMAGTVKNPMGEMAIDGGGKGKYEFFFDPAAGIIVRLKGKTDVELDMTPVGKLGDPTQTTIGYQIERELL